MVLTSSKVINCILLTRQHWWQRCTSKHLSKREMKSIIWKYILKDYVEDYARHWEKQVVILSKWIMAMMCIIVMIEMINMSIYINATSIMFVHLFSFTICFSYINDLWYVVMNCCLLSIYETTKNSDSSLVFRPRLTFPINSLIWIWK